MTSATIDAAHSIPHRGAAPADPVLVRVNTGRWRVLVRGRIIGHVDDVTDDTGRRYRALRFRRSTGRLVSVGEFHRRADAIDALRYAG